MSRAASAVMSTSQWTAASTRQAKPVVIDHVGAGPEVLVDREHGVPERPQQQARAAGRDETQRFPGPRAERIPWPASTPQSTLAVAAQRAQHSLRVPRAASYSRWFIADHVQVDPVRQVQLRLEHAAAHAGHRHQPEQAQ